MFTGSPPLFLHWIAPANLLLRRRLIYRITDFHPECSIAERGRPSLLMRAIYRATLFWRRRVDEFEVLGRDQAERLRDIGIPANRIRYKPDAAPVQVSSRHQTDAPTAWSLKASISCSTPATGVLRTTPIPSSRDMRGTTSQATATWSYGSMPSAVARRPSSRRCSPRGFPTSAAGRCRWNTWARC